MVVNNLLTGIVAIFSSFLAGAGFWQFVRWTLDGRRRKAESHKIEQETQNIMFNQALALAKEYKELWLRCEGDSA